MASLRLVPVPDSALGDTGNTSASPDRNCAPLEAPVRENASYDQLSFGQLHVLCKQRGYHDKDAKAALRTRPDAMDAAENKAKEGSSNDADPSTSVLGKRARNLEEPLITLATVEAKKG